MVKKVLILIFILSIIPLTSATLFDGLVGYWTLNESSGNANNSVSFNSDITGSYLNRHVGTGKIGNAQYFGGDGHLNYANPDELKIYNSEFSINFWFNMTSNSSYQALFCYDQAGGTNGICLLRNWVDKNISLGRIGLSRDLLTINSYDDGLYHMVTFGSNATAHYLYIDGNRIDSLNSLGSSISFINENVFGRQRTTASGYFTGGIDEIAIYNRSLSNSEITNLYNFGNGFTYPFVYTYDLTLITTLNDPINYLSISDAGTYFNASYNISNGNLTNITYYVYNSTSLFNTTTVMVTGTSNNTNVFIDDFIIGTYTWNVLSCGANSSTVLCSFAPANYTLYVGVSKTAESFTNSVLETSRQRFYSEFDLISGSEIATVKLIYNGTQFIVNNVSNNGTHLILEKYIDIPVISGKNETYSFYWSFQYTDVLSTIQNSSLSYQNISYIDFIICNSTYSTKYINFTIYEENSTNLLKSNMEMNNKYWLGSGTSFKNYSYINTSEAYNSYAFCSYPVDQTFKNNMELSYYKTNYGDRKYYLVNASLTNATTYINLYLLPSDTATKFYYDVKQGISFLSNVYVMVNRYFVYNSTYKTISIRKTDEVGKFIEYIKEDDDYRYIIFNENGILGVIDKTGACTTSPCEQTLQLTDTSTDTLKAYNDLIAGGLTYNITYDELTKMVNLYYVDLTGTASYARLLVERTGTKDKTIICDNYAYSTYGSITCNLTAYTGDFMATAYISRSPEKIISYISIFISSLKDTIGENGLIIGIIAVVAIGLVFSFDVTLGLISIPLTLAILKMSNLLSINWAVVGVIGVLVIWVIGRDTNA